MIDFKVDNYGDLELTGTSFTLIGGLELASQYLLMLMKSNPGDLPFDLNGSFKLKDIIGIHITDDIIKAKENEINTLLANKPDEYLSNIVVNITYDSDNDVINFEFTYIDDITGTEHKLPPINYTYTGIFNSNSNYSPVNSLSATPNAKFIKHAIKDNELILDGVNWNIIYMFNNKPVIETLTYDVDITYFKEISLVSLLNRDGIDYNKVAIDNWRIVNYNVYDYKETASDIVITILDPNDLAPSNIIVEVSYCDDKLDIEILKRQLPINNNFALGHRYVPIRTTIYSEFIVKDRLYYFICR